MNTLLERARRGGTPLIDGTRATFVWQGDTAPELIGDFNNFGWRKPPHLLEAAGPDLWTATMEFAEDAYLEYLFRFGEERILDPLNPRTVGHGVASTNNFFNMPGWRATILDRVARGVPRGQVTRHVISNGYLIIGGRRTVYLYRPPVEEPVPLLVVFDGQDYRRLGRLIPIVDNLIAQRRIRPIAMALVHHGGESRFLEYDASEATLQFVLTDVFALAREHLRLLDGDSLHGILGASMGGLMALYAGLRVPNIFGHVLSQSGAFGFDLAGNPPSIRELVRYGPTRSLRIWMDVGRYEWLLDTNREMHALLQERQYDVIYQEYPAAHNYTSWKNDVWRGLEAQFSK